MLAFVCPAIAGATTLAKCQRQTARTSVYAGGMLWKPVGAHFSRVVVVAPRAFGFGPSHRLDLELYTNEETPRKLEEFKMKSDGNCAGAPECLFASTYLARRSGAVYRKRFKKGVIVKIEPETGANSRNCKYYVISRPDRRTIYR